MSEGLGDMALPNTDGTQKEDILFVIDIGTVCQLFYLFCRDLGVKGKVKALQGLLRFEACLLTNQYISKASLWYTMRHERNRWEKAKTRCFRGTSDTGSAADRRWRESGGCH